ncbi:SRPBCC family protein [Thermomonospora catenispora]|uniref:SRPBCC family protein n=1 Tax=Thermomonospora catenispora TaxID=2493090 RepID=UPI00111D4880|nr:SRPBCC family protein [Thermomonospora catenispora]TNY35870.1 ATPase [Thermomonospora catenispora]
MAETEFVIEPGRQDIVIKRVFDAPPDAVFEAFTDAETVARWMGPRGYTLSIDRWDARTGGSYRYETSGPDGSDGFHGSFHEVTAPRRIVQTFEWEGLPGHVTLETAEFQRLGDGRTRYVGTSVFQSVEDRDGMAASGMRQGVNEGFEKLDEILASR